MFLINRMDSSSQLKLIDDDNPTIDIDIDVSNKLKYFLNSEDKIFIVDKKIPQPTYISTTINRYKLILHHSFYLIIDINKLDKQYINILNEEIEKKTLECFFKFLLLNNTNLKKIIINLLDKTHDDINIHQSITEIHFNSKLISEIKLIDDATNNIPTIDVSNNLIKIFNNINDFFIVDKRISKPQNIDITHYKKSYKLILQHSFFLIIDINKLDESEIKILNDNINDNNIYYIFNFFLKIDYSNDKTTEYDKKIKNFIINLLNNTRDSNIRIHLAITEIHFNSSLLNFNNDELISGGGAKKLKKVLKKYK
jgi:deoxycytidine triphosphate deaminase